VETGKFRGSAQNSAWLSVVLTLSRLNPSF